MRPEVRIEVMRRLVAVIEDPSRETSRQSSELDVDRYLAQAELDRERAKLFRRQPVIIAHASELPNPGDFVTEEVAGVPLIVLRDRAGELRVFINACRHRGARLLDAAQGTCNKALTCRYHAWSYRLDGSLLHVPGKDFFSELDQSTLGLRTVSHAVRHGFVWAQLDGEGDQPLDVSSFLGPVLDDDFDAFELATHRVAKKTVRVKTANWKLVMDAFAEGYHVKSLHRKSLARFFLETVVLDDCAPHVRQVGARKTLLEAAKQPPETWDLRKQTTVFYNLFPNSVFVFHPYWLSHIALFPERVDRVRVVHRMLVPDGAAPDDETHERFEKSFTHIDEQVFENEDLAIAESIQSTLASGANDHVLLGGFEEGMRLFHRARDRALSGAVSPSSSAADENRT